MASITGRAELYPILDSDLFTFKPKLNEKSNEIAQNLLTNFYERQLKHVKRLQEFKEIAAGNYREWYCHDKRSKNHHENSRSNLENRSAVNESLSADDNEAPVVSTKEVSHFNERLAQLIRVYRAPLPRRTGIPAVLIPIRPKKRIPRRSAPPQVQTNEPVPIPSSPSAPLLALITTRPTRRMPPIIRPKSPPKIVHRADSPPKVVHRADSPPKVIRRTDSPPKIIRRADSPPKVIRRADSPPKRLILSDPVNSERLKLARDEADRAIKEHKIFTIIGPYPALRESLRRRGWVEKFDRGLLFPSVHEKKKSDKRNNKSDDDDDDESNDDALGDAYYDENPNDGDENAIPPWEENDGYYGILSRFVKTAVPDLVWTVQATYDTSTLNKDQMVNHFERNGCLTTKVGLCSSLKNLPWFHSGSADEFYPRCYKLTQDDERTGFIDDYRLTSCISFLKLIRSRCKGILEPNSSLDMTTSQSLMQKVSSSFIEFALNQVEQFTLARDHEDIDIKQSAQKNTTDEEWKQFIEQFYAASHSYAEIDDMKTYLNRIEQCLKNVEQHWPQYRIDGTRNIWISKPGAKSRGRGIVVYDRLDDMLKLCSSTVTDKAKFIVQKYIERPLLIHNTKFDIRQWFLVSDWNPLTIWMYKDSYLRFCTEHFSLATRERSVHLCNYSIQKHYKNNSNRHADLPVENMWTSPEFIEKYLRPKKLTAKWESFIYPAMKDAILCSMLVAQDTIDTRKNSFELFGADFMLSEDLQPWLIEINCSPTMARCTAVTTEMCDSVLEDTCKVIIDRKYERATDTGRFELIHKGTPVPVPIYIGIELRIEGKPYKTVRTNYNTTKITTSVPAPSPPKALTDSNTTQHDTSLSKNGKNTQASTDNNDSTSSTDSASEKTPDGHVNNKPKQDNKLTKKPKTNRITVDSLPFRPLIRSKTSDYIPSSLQENDDHNISTIVDGEFLFEDQETKSSNNFPFLRRLQKSLLSHKAREQQLDTNDSNVLQRQKTSLNTVTSDDTSTASAPLALITTDVDSKQIPVISVA